MPEPLTFGTLLIPYIEHAALPKRQLLSPLAARAAAVARDVFRMSCVLNRRLLGRRGGIVVEADSKCRRTAWAMSSYAQPSMMESEAKR